MVRKTPPFVGDVDAYLLLSDADLARAVGSRPARRTPRWGNWWGAAACLTVTCAGLFVLLLWGIHQWGWR